MTRKRVTSFLIAFAMAITTFLPIHSAALAASMPASVQSVVNYASNSNNSSGVLCAEFITNSLSAGGYSVSSSTINVPVAGGSIAARNPRVHSVALFYYLKDRYTSINFLQSVTNWSAANKNTDTRTASYVSTLEPGDIVFVKGTNSDVKDDYVEFGHVVIITKKENNKLYYSARNSNVTNKEFAYSNSDIHGIVKLYGSFDTSSTSTPPSTPSTSSTINFYDGTLIGSATKSYINGRYYVGSIGGGSGVRCSFNSSAASSSATLKLTYRTGEARNATISINGVQQTVAFTGNDWNAWYDKSITASLRAGLNEITITGGSGNSYWAPDFSSFLISTSSTPTVPSTSSTIYFYDGTLIGSATKSYINGRNYVGSIGGGNGVRYSFNSSAASSSATLKLTYRTGEARNATISINGVQQTVAFTGNDWNAWYDKSITVSLRAGLNEITITGGSGSTYWAPDFYSMSY